MKTIRVSLFLVLLAGTASLLAAADTVWQVSYTKNDLLADVRLNGYPICRFSNQANNSAALMIGPWLRPGRNELTVSLAAKPVAGDEDSDSLSPGFSFSLFTLDRANPSADKNEVFHLKLPMDWKDRVALPWRMDFSIYLDKPPANRLWEQAQPLTIDTGTRDEAKALMARLFTALANKDVDSYFELFKWGMEDMYAAYGWNTPEYMEKVKASLPEVFNSAEFAYVEGNADQLSYEAVPGSGNRLIAVRGLSDKPAVDAGPFRQDTLFLARIDGVLTIVRN